ncbi:MAG: hypothetical protein E5W69_02035 [Mesorhizobium sp.]|nr:MAG: hypothetical protein E5W69_02035 [Mesorhizobium sp.]
MYAAAVLPSPSQSTASCSVVWIANRQSRFAMLPPTRIPHGDGEQWRRQIFRPPDGKLKDRYRQLAASAVHCEGPLAQD